MARIETELGKGQITPQAQPVDAFIQPSQVNLAQPSQPAQLGNPQGLRAVSTGGTTFVQGANSYKDLAEALAPFSKNAVELLQNAGLMYAQGQIQQGEQRAKEEALKAMALNDASMETDELRRAAFNRQLASKEPQAGGLMAVLNPYQQIGWERGLSKMAGQEAVTGLPAFIAQNADKINYTAPDQGFGALAQLQAQYTSQLTQKYGIGIGTPGFQKYTLPELEKAQEKVQTQHLTDRKNWFDTAAVDQSANLIRQIYLNADKDGYVEFNGQKIYKTTDRENYDTILSLTATQALRNLVLRGSEKGDGRKRAAAVYKQLQADAIYNSMPEFQRFVDNLPGTDVQLGPDGKAVLDESGNPLRVTMGAQFRSEAIDTRIKYEDAVAQRTRRERDAALTGAETGFEDTILRAAQGLPEGPERKAAIDAAQRAWYERYGRPQGISFAELTRRRNDLVKEANQMNVEASDPGAVSQFWAQFDQSLGSDFNAVEWRTRRIPAAAANIVDTEERARFERQARDAVTEREKEQAQMTPYARARDAELNRVIDANIREWYDSSDPDQKRLIETSKQRQRSALTTRANAVIAAEEARLKRRLTETEVMRITRAAFYGDKDLKMEAYGSGPGGGRPGSRVDDLFPGSQRSRAQAPLGPEGAVPERRYDIKDLGNITDGRVLKTYRQNFILTPEATLSAWEMVKKGQVLPGPLRQAITKSGAPTAADFVLAQMRLYRQRLYKQDPTGQEWRQFNPSQADQNRVLQQGNRAAAGGNALSTAVAMVQSGMPRLAQLGSTALNALTGTAPATASEMPGGLVRLPVQPARSGSRPGGAPSASGRPAVGALESAPLAPVLPPPQRPGGSAAPQSQPQSAAQPAAQPRRGFAVTVNSADDLPPGWTLDERGMPRISMSSWEGLPSRVVAMRPLGPFSVGPTIGSLEKPASVVYERPGGQPGVDLYFPSKRFPAVLSGVVKDVSRQGGPGSGYGNYVVVESTDPLTGRKVDVLYAHLADGVSVRPGQRIEAGQIIGRQGGTGHVVSQDGTIASVDFFAPRPAGSKDMAPYSGFDALRRHVVSTLQQGGGGSAVGAQKVDGYLKRLSYLETRIRNIPNAEGSPGRGYFQALPAFSQEAIAASGGIDPRDADYERSSQATWAWIVKHRPKAAEAIRAGRYDEADRILRPTWPSLPGGSQAQPDEVQRQARRYLRS